MFTHRAVLADRPIFIKIYRDIERRDEVGQ